MMKKSKLLGLFSAGFLALLLAGCFNPIEAIPPNQDDLSIGPFTLDVLIGKDTEDGRSIAGPDAARIKGTGIRNIIQLIVADSSGQVVAFDEVRRERDGEEAALLRIDSIAFGQTYHFLLLMGHWERKENAEDGTYQYTDDPPTLLAAGLKKQEITGSGKVTVTMWPIEVDTVFTAGVQTKAPTAGGSPGKVTLHPVDWNVTWTIKRGLTENGLTDLVKAQNIVTDAGETLLLNDSQTLVREGNGDGQPSSAVLSGTLGNVITRSIGDYTARFGNIGKEGSVNFNLEYVPFNLTNGAGWTPYDDDSVFDLKGKPPVWIIRNGVNDKAQNEGTNFNTDNPGTGNWNGAAAFVIAADTPAPGELVIKDGLFVGPAGSDNPHISFTTEGYEGTAEAWYAVVPGGTGSAPAYSAYTESLGAAFAAGSHQATVTLPEEGEDDNFDIYVVLFKDGKVSGPIKINTKEGEVYGDWIWGDEPYKGYYVAVNGKDEDPGTKQQPLRTVQQALIKLAALYAADASWPDKGTEDEVSGGIIILNEVPVAEQITINNSNSSYPPIILRDDPETPGGKLKAQASDSINGNYLLVIENNARVILGGGLILEGTGNSENNIRGVGVVNNSTFTMNGGEISLNYAIDSSGVHVNNSTFTMNAGVISGNTSTNYASGVSVVDGGTFIMNDGKISGNTAGTNVGGVHVVTGSLFIMKGGEISGNTSTSATGGVYIGAGGSSVPFGQFEKTGGTIYGVDEYDPEDRDSKGNSGNAVWVGYSIPTYRKATTSGPGDILRFNYPLGGEAIGWDVVE